MIASRFHSMCRHLFGIALSGVLVSCAPKPGDIYTNAAQKACAEARAADSRAKSNTAEYDSLKLVIAEKQAAKIQLERLRSRIKTKQMTDADLAEWLFDQERKPEPDTIRTTPDSTTKTAPDTAISTTTDSIGTSAPVDSVTVSPALESAPADTSAPAVTPEPETGAPSDTTGTTTPALETPSTGESSGESSESAVPETGTETPGTEGSTEPAPGESTESGE